MEYPALLSLMPLPRRLKQALEESFEIYQYYGVSATKQKQLLEEVGPEVRAVVTVPKLGGFSESMLAALPNLEIVSCCSVGFDHVCVDACRKRGVVVTNTPGVLTDDVADSAIMMMLASVRRLLEGVNWIERGDWLARGMMPLNTCIGGKTLGIVGLGRIGQAIAKRAEGFGMTVVYTGRHPKPDCRYRYYDDLVAMARDVDVLAPAIPGGADTDGLISRKVLEALGPTGYFINIARGSVVDEKALTELLVAGQLAGAGLDVFADEPNVPTELIGMENVILQPHVASGTVETRRAMGQLVVDNLKAHFSGQPVLTPVN